MPYIKPEDLDRIVQAQLQSWKENGGTINPPLKSMETKKVDKKVTGKKSPLTLSLGKVKRLFLLKTKKN